VEPAAHPERQPGRSHASPPQLLSVKYLAGRIEQRSDGPEHPITLFYMALGVTQITRTLQAIGRDRTRMLNYLPL
jgi:hypothetical protein